MKRYVLTGGPCAGKTTVLEILKKRGFSVVPEAARDMIVKNTANGGDVLPWKNLQKFQDTTVWIQFWRELFSKPYGILFLDRGIVDPVGYCAVFTANVPKITRWFGRNRYEKIFLLDLLPDYMADESRKEDREMAKLIHEELRKGYISYGYEVIQVPFLTPEERVEFILRSL